MNSGDERWRRATVIFEAVIDRDASSQSAMLDGLCGEDHELRREVAALLATDRRAVAASPEAEPDASGITDTEPAPPGIGAVVGSFRLVDVIGVGGMATVFRGERLDREFTQQVAVKVISTPVGDREIARRFVSERHILASLTHPHVVALLDGGVTADEYAYLVMERVDGRPITRYCVEQHLGLRDRLTLFRVVCSTVHHAHRHGVVH